MAGTVKEHIMKVLHLSKIGDQCWPCAAMYVADVIIHRATHRLLSLPAFGEVVAVTNPRRLWTNEAKWKDSCTANH
eukprot:3664022-Prorocentrum_lima.AAC.1